jgi:hypothetical protein
VEQAYDAGRIRGREEAMRESQGIVGSFDGASFEVGEKEVLVAKLSVISKRNFTDDTERLRRDLALRRWRAAVGGIDRSSRTVPTSVSLIGCDPTND